MVKTVELRRHTDNDGDRLTDEGVAAAEEIGRRLSPPYDAFVSTGAARAVQTLDIWRSAAGGRAPLEQSDGLRSRHEDRWRAAYKAADSGDLRAMQGADPDLVRDDSATLGAALQEVFDRLPEEGRALVVGHSPTNEAAVLGLTGQYVDPLDKGGGVLVIQVEGNYRVEPLR
ncbi:MAG: histidine phosphatase family protein [Geodermatophilaceae bacterium]|nr:histidine phosphatase family protein [Geodermatophilaceae bacterium]